MQPWAQQRPGGMTPPLFGTDGDDPIEQVAGADLIIATKDDTPAQPRGTARSPRHWASRPRASG